MAARPTVVGRVDAGDLVRFARTVKLWASDQLPFASAAALTDTAKDARAFVRSGLVAHFRVRNAQLGNAIAYQAADKRARPIVARVGTAPWAGFLTLQAIGGVKRAESGGRVAVPTQAVLRTASGAVAARFRPRRLTASKGLVEELLEERGLIAVRPGRARERKKGRPVLYYTLVKGARIPPRWPFQAEVRETAEARLADNFRRRLEQALATRR